MFNEDCRVCRSAKVYEIDDALQGGDPSEVIALATGFRTQEVDAHLSHSLEFHLDKADDSEPLTILETLRRNAQRLECAIIKARNEDDATLFLRSSAELVKNLALQNEIANGRDTESSQTETAQIRATARKLVSAMADLPEMKTALSEALKRHFGDDGDWEE